MATKKKRGLLSDKSIRRLRYKRKSQGTGNDLEARTGYDPASD